MSCLLQTDVSTDSCGGPSVSKRPHTDESTSSISPEDTDENESIASSASSNHSLRSDHGAIRSHGARRGQG